MKYNNLNNKKYLRISKDSGCVSANYNVNETPDNHVTLETKDNFENSGYFTHIHRQRYN